MRDKRFVKQIELAKELNLTDRRVRQMTEQHLLPPAHHKNGYDLDRCKQFYRLFREGSDRDWERFYDLVLHEGELAESLFDQAMSDRGTLADVTSASIAVQHATTGMHFITAARSKTQSEKDLFHLIWKREDDTALGALLARAMELMGAIGNPLRQHR